MTEEFREFPFNSFEESVMSVAFENEVEGYLTANQARRLLARHGDTMLDYILDGERTFRADHMLEWLGY